MTFIIKQVLKSKTTFNIKRTKTICIETFNYSESKGIPNIFIWKNKCEIVNRCQTSFQEAYK